MLQRVMVTPPTRALVLPVPAAQLHFQRHWAIYNLLKQHSDHILFTATKMTDDPPPRVGKKDLASPAGCLGMKDA